MLMAYMKDNASHKQHVLLLQEGLLERKTSLSRADIDVLSLVSDPKLSR